MSGNRRLDTNVRLSDEAQRLHNEARTYEHIRREYLLNTANQARISLTILESTGIEQTADSISQGNLTKFKIEVDRQITALVKQFPERVRQSAFADWMNEDMNDQEKARREIASWVDNKKIAFFDTETTGLDDTNVPFSAAACGCDDVPLCVIQMLTLDAKGEIIKISPEASRVTGVSMDIIHQYMALEDDEHAIYELENLMNNGYILTGYNTQFDRGMMCRALEYAKQRATTNATKDEILDSLPTKRFDRLFALHKYFKDPSHWLETKDTFVRAIGLDPNDTPGRKTRLQDVARATKALATGENQEHGALADCLLLARIVRNIRKEIDDMAPKTPKTTVAKQTDDELASKDLSGYISALETENEELKEKLAEAQTNEHDIRQAAVEKVEDLETRHETALNRIRELENLCEQYQQGDTLRHHEARDVTWSDIEINGFQFNFTRREGETVDQSINAILDHVRVLQTIKSMEKVATLRVGLKGDWKPLKGFDKPTNGKPAQDDQPPADEKPATPKGNQPPAANKPGTPPPAKPATPPQQQGQSQGKTTGEKKSQQCDRIVRHEVDGKSMFDLLYNLSNGKPADYPLSPSKKDVPTLEKAIINAGYDIASLEPGEVYDLPILVEWTVGGQIPKSDPPKFFRDNMTFTITSNEPF